MLFKIVLKHIPNINICFDADASIVKSGVFELALVKIQINKFNDRSPEKRGSIDYLCKNVEVVRTINTSNKEDLAEIDMREFEEKMVIKRDYIDSRFLVPSSNSSECIFLQQNVC